MTGENFTMMLRPWLAEAPKSFDNPKIDFTRFNLSYWQKWERMLRYARDRDVIISAILEISTHKAQPAAGSEDERRYIRYAVARLAAFSNITGTSVTISTASVTKNGRTKLGLCSLAGIPTNISPPATRRSAHRRIADRIGLVSLQSRIGVVTASIL
jgi:hypothetical protein